MDKIFSVKANFSNFEETWEIIIGIFTKEELAKNKKNKWDNFFKTHKNMFEEPINWVPSESDKEFDVNEWDESDDHFKLKMKYEMIYNFDEISIEEIQLNKDIFIQNLGYNMTDPLKNLISQWERDYKINKIL